MSSNQPVVVCNEPRNGTSAGLNRHVEVIELELNVFGELLHFRISVQPQPAGLADLVPLARMISTKVVSVVKRNIAVRGDSVPCRAGCSRCCRYLVPVSIPEALCLAREMGAMVSWKRLLMSESCLLMARCILELTPKRLFSAEFKKGRREEALAVRDISDWYTGINLPCPFLLGNLCMIYDKRPLACREHLVTGLAQGCSPDSVNEARVVRMPVSILDAVVQLTSELTGNGIETIVLPFLLAWYHNNRKYTECRWPATYLVRRFVSILTTLNMENKEMMPSPHEK